MPEEETLETPQEEKSQLEVHKEIEELVAPTEAKPVGMATIVEDSSMVEQFPQHDGDTTTS